MLAVISSAQAQRDAGAKARGEFGTGFWDSNAGGGTDLPVSSTTETRQNFSFTPVAPSPAVADENRQSFSHQPGEFTKEIRWS
ncbi:MAG: hypothetical protein U0903_17730 [Planctomycetales bacterium]